MSARRPFARLVRLALALALLAALIATIGARQRGASGASSNARAAYPARFPPGPGSDIAERSCTLCHSPMLVTQQAKDSLGWEKSLSLMEKWGAPVAPAERDSLRAYLLARFGARPKSP